MNQGDFPPVIGLVGKWKSKLGSSGPQWISLLRAGF